MKHTSYTLVFLLSATAIISCKTGWSDEQRRAYIDNCTKAQIVNERSEKYDRDYCTCLQQKIEEKYPDPKDTANMTPLESNTWSAKCHGYQ